MAWWLLVIEILLKVLGPIILEKLVEWITAILEGHKSVAELNLDIASVKPVYQKMVKRILANPTKREYRLEKIKEAIEKAKAKLA